MGFFRDLLGESSLTTDLPLEMVRGSLGCDSFLGAAGHLSSGRSDDTPLMDLSSFLASLDFSCLLFFLSFRCFVGLQDGYRCNFWVPRLTYEAPYNPDKATGFKRFLKGSLLSHQPHALETLHIDIAFCLFTCKKLVVLKLKGRIKLKLPSTVCLPSLKTLHLRLTLLNNESTHKILSNCPLLYDVRLEHDVMSKLHIAMPSLQRLTIVIESIFGPSSNLLDCYFRRLEKISTPSLKYLNIQDFASILYVRFRIKSPSNFEDTSIYRQTVQLELSMYSDVFEELLIYLLKSSMNLFVLKINNKFTPRVCWKPPSSVPTCLLSSLQTLEWREYTGTCAEKEVLSYLLKHALCLKTAKIINESCLFKKTKDLLSMPRGSTTCRLVLKQ
ncbi:hypothetical protein DY000_02017420 [Brassica cretica]|uniref:FBD domain-containing protein n=1 Tax=Brassica cretica TaxID=69181 RepID=A0ABQ7CXL0_BRACR|nr:hypothetical protein DY000_02017420 [Brassica cretica]